MFNTKNRVKFLLIITICVTLIMGLGSTYAFFVYRESGSNVSLVGGEVKVTFVNDNNYLTTGNSYPISDNTGKVLPYYSDFSVNTVTDKVDIKYEIQLIPDEGNTLDSKYIKVYLTDQEDNPITNVLYYNELHEAEYNDDAKAVYTSYMTETGTKDFRLRLWIDESYNIKDGETFGFTINLYAVNGKANFLSDKIEDTLPLTDPDIDGTRYVYGQTEDNYLWYSGKLWRIVSINGDGSVKLVTQGNMTTLAWDTSSTNTDYSTSQVRRWLNNEFLPTLYDANNLLVDSTWDYTTYISFPTTKLPTTSFVSEKVGLLNVYEFTKSGGTTSSNTTNTFLAHGYHWWTMSPRTGGAQVFFIEASGYVSDAPPTYNYGVRPAVNLKSNIQVISGNGTKSDPYVIDGDKNTGFNSELLNNRISGEYINFNNTLYRIVGIEEINGQLLTKVTMADYSITNNTLTNSLAFGADDSQRIFSSTYGIGLYLENWYQAGSTSEAYATTYIKDNYKAMIATSGENGDGIVWYTGPISPTYPSRHDYAFAKTGTPIYATIGLGYYGEMFSSQFGDGYASSYTTWLMTIYSDWAVSSIALTGTIAAPSPTENNGVRPSFYLKSGVKIKSGSGMLHDPYEIEYETKTLSDEVEDKLTLTEPDMDGTRYVRGATVDNNYVWYSGKLWRIVALNSDGTVKLVTQNPMTSIAWNTIESADYSTSQVRSWLKNEFLPTINENLIVDSTWDYTIYESFPSKKINENQLVVSDKVGLLNVYDYMMTGGTDDSSTSKTFLNNGYTWWTLATYSDKKVWAIYLGSAGYYNLLDGNPIRPSVNLKSDITITGEGNGEIETPYILERDTKVGQANELLSNRISGEYINFNNVKYRIVGIENGLTKITMADNDVKKNILSTPVMFGASEDETTFSTTYGIGKYLNDWYNATSATDTSGTYAGLYLSETSKVMIATPSDGVRWYAGPDDNSGISYNYTKATLGTAIEATIGLPRYGEMFSTEYGDGPGSVFGIWLMTIYSSGGVWLINYNGYADAAVPTYNMVGVRPSFYLKSNVKITGGSGMPHDPYILTQ